MTVDLSLPVNLAVAYTTCLVGMASPGPTNMAIMSVAMNSGRTSAMAVALGVLSGSLMWGLLASFGLSTVLAAWSGALIVMKIAAGIYLLWLAYKAGRSAMSGHKTATSAMGTGTEGFVKLYIRGAGMHLTNPKAIFVWLSIVSMGLPVNPHISDSMLIVAGGACIGLFVFGTYAVAFSTEIVRKTYRSLSRWIDGTLACVFGYAGMRMLISEMPST